MVELKVGHKYVTNGKYEYTNGTIIEVYKINKETATYWFKVLTGECAGFKDYYFICSNFHETLSYYKRGVKFV